MTVEILKPALKSPSAGEDDTRAVVRRMLAECESGGEARVREYARELDGWDGDIVVARAEI
ncbi:MAG: histidinol dehydrogenase, partial [Gammaproteobacteria bacterium]|nr:histidinol dehydrogenase [Gammaproteobacteria bacterium]